MFLCCGLQMGYQNWLDPTTLNSTPTTYPCLVTNGCPGLGQPSPYTGIVYQYSGPESPQCEPGYSTTVPYVPHPTHPDPIGMPNAALS